MGGGAAGIKQGGGGGANGGGGGGGGVGLVSRFSSTSSSTIFRVAFASSGKLPEATSCSRRFLSDFSLLICRDSVSILSCNSEIFCFVSMCIDVSFSRRSLILAKLASISSYKNVITNLIIPFINKILLLLEIIIRDSLRSINKILILIIPFLESSNLVLALS